MEIRGEELPLPGSKIAWPNPIRSQGAHIMLAWCRGSKGRRSWPHKKDGRITGTRLNAGENTLKDGGGGRVAGGRQGAARGTRAGTTAPYERFT